MAFTALDKDGDTQLKIKVKLIAACGDAHL